MKMLTPKFPLGQVVATPGEIEAMRRSWTDAGLLPGAARPRATGESVHRRGSGTKRRASRTAAALVGLQTMKGRSFGSSPRGGDRVQLRRTARDGRARRHAPVAGDAAAHRRGRCHRRAAGEGARRPVPLLRRDLHPPPRRHRRRRRCTTRCAVLALTHPTLFTSSDRHVAVETPASSPAGMTVIDRRTLIERPPPNCTVLETVDADAAWRVIVDAIAPRRAHDERPRRSRARHLPAPVRPHAALHARRAARLVVVAATASGVVFARSRGGSDPVNCLWVVDLATGDERLVADPRELLGDAATPDDELPPRSGRGASGPARRPAASPPSPPTPTSTVAAFALAGRLFVADLRRAHGPRAAGRRAGVRPPPDPTGAPRRLRRAARRCASVELDGAGASLAGGRARRARHRHVGQRRLHRRRGDGPPPRLLVEPGRRPRSPSAGSTSRAVQGWHIADPADPAPPPAAVRYPAAGTANADVTLHLCPLDGSRATRGRVGPRRASRTSPTCTGPSTV